MENLTDVTDRETTEPTHLCVGFGKMACGAAGGPAVFDLDLSVVTCDECLAAVERVQSEMRAGDQFYRQWEADFRRQVESAQLQWDGFVGRALAGIEGQISFVSLSEPTHPAPPLTPIYIDELAERMRATPPAPPTLIGSMAEFEALYGRMPSLDEDFGRYCRSWRGRRRRAWVKLLDGVLALGGRLRRRR